MGYALIAGQTGSGVMQPSPLPQVQVHGSAGHGSTSQVGHTQVQSPSPAAGPWHTPEVHSTPSWQGTPRPIQEHMFRVSAMQLASSVWLSQASTAIGTSVPGAASPVSAQSQ